jgi:hypothetical protein
MKIKNITMGAVGSALALSLAQTASAQGWIDINNYDASAGLFLEYIYPNFSTSLTSLPLNSYVELLGGTSVGTLAPIVSKTTGGSVFSLSNPELGGTLNANGPGTGTYFDVGAGAVIGVPDGAIGTFQFLVWIGGSGASPADANAEFESAVWTQVNGLQPVGINPPNPALLDIPFTDPVQGLTVANVNDTGLEGLIMITEVPEPTTLTLAGLGGLASLVVFRHKQS